MKKKLFNFFVIGAFFAIIFTACGHKPSLDGLENMIIPKPVKVTWSPASSADTEIKVGRQNSAGHVFNLLQSGDEVYTGLKLWINASRKTKALDRDKTTINGKSIKDIGSDIAGFTVDGLIYYTIPHTDTKVHIDFIFRDAEPVNIEWKSKNSDGVVKRWLDYVEDGPPNYDGNTSGSFAEDSVLYFSGLPNHGKIIKKWYINGKEQNTAHRFIAYKVLKNDIVGGKILIEAEFGDKKSGIKVYASSTDESKGSVSNNISIKPNYENNNWEDHTQGHPCEEGNVIQFEAIPKPGYMVDKWFIKDQELQAGGMFFHYKVVEKDIVSDSRIDIKVSFKQAPKIKIEWSVKDTNQGFIIARRYLNDTWTDINYGDELEAGADIQVRVFPKEGFAPDTWYINGKEAYDWTKGEPKFWYTVDINDIANGSIKISHKFKIAEKIPMEFSIKKGNGKISVHNPKTNALITDTQIYEGTQLRIKASPFLGSKFKNFELNGNEITEGIWQWNGNSGIYVFDYTVKAEDKNSDTISIKAVFENDPAAHQGTIPVEFAVESGHEINGTFIAKFNKKEFESGYKFNKDDWFNFYALPKDGYQAKWFVNGTEYHTGNNCYIELYTENIVDGKLSVKAQFVPANPVRLNFSSEGNGNIRAEKLMGAEWVTVNSGDTVYEGNRIYFGIEGAEGNIADWFINGKEIDEIGWAGSLGFNITNHNEGGVCTVKASFRKAETYPVSFKIAEGGEGKGSLSIEYWDIVTRTTVTTSEQNISIKEGSSDLMFMVSLNEGAQVEKWTINGEAQQHNPKTFWFGALHKSKLGGQNKLKVVVHLK